MAIASVLISVSTKAQDSDGHSLHAMAEASSSEVTPEILPPDPRPGVNDLLLRLPTTPATVWNSFFKGWVIRAPVTIYYKGQRCTLPITYHPDVGGEAPTLLLHGVTDTAEAFQPYLKYLGKRRNKHFILMDWPRNGKADCDQVTTTAEAAHVVAEVYKEFMKIYNANKNYPNQLKFPAVVGGHSMGGSFLAPYIVKNEPEFSQARVVMLAPALLERDAMKRVADEILNAETQEDGTNFLKKVVTKGANPVLDLTQEAPILGKLLIKPISGKAHLNRMKRSRPYLSSLFQKNDQGYKEAVEVASSLDPARVIVIVGKEDQLCRPSDLSKTFLERYAKRIRYIDCGHNINRDCFKMLPKGLW